ncbi:hypothetical protein C5167_003949 [Papaver somniferum]|nr:hypothetical protein C5167_003949 [Papaver somniferum]
MGCAGSVVSSLRRKDAVGSVLLMLVKLRCTEHTGLSECAAASNGAESWVWTEMEVVDKTKIDSLLVVDMLLLVRARSCGDVMSLWRYNIAGKTKNGVYR